MKNAEIQEHNWIVT